MSLHDRIMAKRCRISIDEIGPEFMREAYRDGYKQCKNEAAQLAKEADELMAEMVEALTALMTDCRDRDNNLNALGGFMPYYKVGHEALAKYNTYKERNNEQ